MRHGMLLRHAEMHPPSEKAGSVEEGQPRGDT